MNAKVEAFADRAEELLFQINDMVPKHKITLICRNPDDAEQYIIMTIDDLDEVKAAIDRRMNQENARSEQP